MSEETKTHHAYMVLTPKYGWHCTTAAKLKRYKSSGRIISPVRFWPDYHLAKDWSRKTGRDVILKIEIPGISYPMPDHKPAYWSPDDVTKFEVLKTY